jgi:RHS repeat-associated protein
VLVNASDQSPSAQYEYSPFGELIRATGPLATTNPFRWSTKFWDEDSGLVYYGFRYYSPSLGRWINRDPIDEGGGLSLYAFVNNNSLNAFDPLGDLIEQELLGAALHASGRIVEYLQKAGFVARVFIRQSRTWTTPKCSWLATWRPTAVTTTR